MVLVVESSAKKRTNPLSEEDKLNRKKHELLLASETLSLAEKYYPDFMHELRKGRWTRLEDIPHSLLTDPEDLTLPLPLDQVDLPILKGEPSSLQPMTRKPSRVKAQTILEAYLLTFGRNTSRLSQ